uniref:Uncharacterized protein n=1 Tax=Tanacetum cinerariifolium TaxID=118510 RepID=A0A699JGR5_TANCI|nr:hypothetical protein [Tanacetum cinerariifolium]
MRDVSEREACPTDSDFIADQDKATIAKSSTLPHDTAPRVTSPAAVEGSMQQTINELTALCTSLQRQHSALLVQFKAQEVEINKLKERVKVLEDNQGVIGARSADDAPIKGRRIDEEEEGIDVPTGSYSIPTVGTPAVDIHTGSKVVPTASLIVATATVVTPYSRRKGKEVMVESDTLKKQRLQEQIDAEVARELEEQQEREDKRMIEQIARDAYVARIHAEEELQDFIPMGSKEEAERLKRKGFNLEQEKAKKQKTSEELVPIEEVYVQALQVKHPIMTGRQDLNQLWVLVKEYLSIRPASSDKEMELWVELKRLYEPDPEDQLWAQTQNYMHVPTEWKLYDLSGVHHVTAKDKDIFMLVEKDYPLRKGLALVMISYRLQVENYSQMAEDLIRKIYNIANSPR